MRFLVDENVPDSVALFLRGRGHDVELVRDRLGQMTPDAFIAWVAEEIGAIVVTADKDFSQIVTRVPTGGRGAFRRLGRVSLRCRPSNARRRIEEFIEEIEREFERVERRPDKRLITEITDTSFRIVR